MTENKQNNNDRTDRRPDCVTEIRMGNTVLIVSGFFKKDTTDTATDKMMKVLEAEAAAGHKAPLSP
ncbi:transposon-encoded TnpW family protein [Blautia faecis]|uniref:transposon-encoded TnpW family protein n=1 Tax=Blautia faecis TaxID=871665 RepID=UPI0028A4F5BE|nr:transposon-encoded TnpW family protein [Blautia faecis]MDT4369649.1 transposon-encoded TnpW family protein [Blautia faecis]